MAKIINVLGYKGGVGKTTTVCNIAYGLSKHSKKILVVDSDPQANSTSIFLDKKSKKLKASAADEFVKIYYRNISEGKGSDDLETGMKSLSELLDKTSKKRDLYYLLKHGVGSREEILNCIHSTKYKNISVLPGSQNLDTIDRNLKTNQLTVFKDIFNLIDNDFDYILIDNQPIQNMISFGTIISSYKKMTRF